MSSDDQLRAYVQQLATRVQALEAATPPSALATGKPPTVDESLQANYLTLSPSGVVGALFPGGVQMIEQTNATYNAAHALGWLDSAGGGEIREAILGYFAGAAEHALVMRSEPDAQDFAQINLLASAGGTVGESIAQVVAADSSGASVAAKIIDSTGESDFTQGWIVPPPTGIPATDTANITNAINACIAAGGGVITLQPAPVSGQPYQINAQLPTITVPMVIRGAGGGVNGTGATTLNFVAGLPGFRLNANAPVTLESFDITSADSTNGAGTINTDHGIYALPGDNCHGSRIRDVQITGFGGDGIHFDAGAGNTVGCIFERVRIRWCNGHGFYANGSNASVMSLRDVDVAEGGLFGYFMGAPGLTLINCQAALMDNQPGRTVTDGVLVSGSQTFASATANFTAADLGQQISGPSGIPGNNSIIGIIDAQHVTMKFAASANVNPATARIHVGGSVSDNVLGCGYINQYTEAGQGSNILIGSSSNAWMISGGWASPFFGLNFPKFLLFADGLPGSVTDPLGSNAAVVMPPFASPIRVSDYGGGSEVEIFASGQTPGIEFASTGAALAGVAEILNANGVTFSGPLYPCKDSNAAQTGTALRAGQGAPNNANGNNGDYYFNGTGAAGSLIYLKSAGAWVNVL